MSPVLITLMLIGFGILVGGGIAFTGVVRAMAGGEDLEDRMHTYVAVPEEAIRRAPGRRWGWLWRLRVRLNATLSSLGTEDMALELMSANWAITVSEYLLIRFGVILAGFLLGWFLFGSLISGLALAFISYFLPGIYLRWSTNRRRQRFERQLVDVLVLMNGAVRAGFSLLQSMEVVEREMKAPASEEFHRVTREVGLGLSLGQALSNLAARMQNPDLDMLVTAVKIHFQVGGNLTTMLTAVTETIRERVRLFSEVRVITTQQRYTGYLITLLPFFIGAMMFMMNPEYMKRLFEPGMQCVPVAGLAGILIGNFFIRRIVKIEI